MIRCIVFDLSEVLIAGLIGVERILAERFGIPPEGVLKSLGGERLGNLCCGRCSEEEYLDAVLAAAGWRVTSEGLRKAIRDNFHQEVEGMRELVARLSEKYPLVLLSDHGREWAAYIEGVHPFLQVFSPRVFSFETGATKNSTETFRRLCRVLGRDPCECVFVDDNAGNVAHAAEAGMTAVRFTGRAELEREFGRLGLWNDC